MRTHSMSFRLPVLALAIAGWIAAPPASAQCPPDAFEPNDTCAQSASIAVGAHANLTLEPGAADFYRVQVPAGWRLEARLHLALPDPGLFALFRLFRDDGSPDPCAGPNSALAFDLVELGQTEFLLAWSADSGAPTSFIVGLESVVGACAAYALDLTAFPDPCNQLPPDVFEPNDSCASPAALGAGVFANLNVGVGDLDYYSVSVATGELATLVLSGLSAGDVVDVWAWELGATCGDLNQISAGTAVHGPGSAPVFLFNPSGPTTSFVVAVKPRPNQAAQSGFCVGYGLALSTQVDPCGVASGDPFEPNELCATAPLLASSQTGLSVAQAMDQDWYTLDVPAHSTLRLLSTSANAGVQRPLMLYSGCAGNPDFLASSHPVYFNEDPRHFLQWTNASAQSVETRLLVVRPVGALFCDVYDLDVGTTLGTPFCVAAKNSTGEAARLSASGSTTPSVGVLTLTAAPVPQQKVGLAIMSPTTKAPTPFGQGYLCLSAPIVRYPATTTASGSLVTTLDWTGPSGLIQQGQSWAFQAWFRDPAGGGAGFNLSEGLRIDFQ
jgi:hypothetical protein